MSQLTAINFVRRFATDSDALMVTLLTTGVQKGMYMATWRNFRFMADQQFYSEQDLIDITQGALFGRESRDTALRMEQGIIASSRKLLQGYSIDVDCYNITVGYGQTMAMVEFAHRETGNIITINNVVFDTDTGYIESSEPRFGYR